MPLPNNIPVAGDVLGYNGQFWVPTASSSGVTATSTVTATVYNIGADPIIKGGAVMLVPNDWIENIPADALLATAIYATPDTSENNQSRFFAVGVEEIPGCGSVLPAESYSIGTVMLFGELEGVNTLDMAENGISDTQLFAREYPSGEGELILTTLLTNKSTLVSPSADPYYSKNMEFGYALGFSENGSIFVNPKYNNRTLNNFSYQILNTLFTNPGATLFSNASDLNRFISHQSQNFEVYNISDTPIIKGSIVAFRPNLSTYFDTETEQWVQYLEIEQLGTYCFVSYAVPGPFADFTTFDVGRAADFIGMATEDIPAKSYDAEADWTTYSAGIIVTNGIVSGLDTTIYYDTPESGVDASALYLDNSTPGLLTKHPWNTAYEPAMQIPKLLEIGRVTYVDNTNGSIWINPKLTSNPALGAFLRDLYISTVYPA